MTQDERLIELETRIRSHGKVTLEYICEHYQISYDSARRDLVKLSKLPDVLRIRGGAILDEKKVSIPYTQRIESDPIKQQLAAYGASLVKQHDIIFLDAGTTCALVASHLIGPINIITNSLESLHEISNKPDIKKCVLGGMFDDFSHAILGNITIEQIKKYQASKAFIGVSALSESGITTDTEMDANLKLAMAQQSKQVICIAIGNKFNTRLMYQSCSWSDIDCIVTDSHPPENIIEQIKRYDVELIIID